MFNFLLIQLKTKDGSSTIEQITTGLRVLPELTPSIITPISVELTSLEATAKTTMTTQITLPGRLPALGYIRALYSSAFVIRDGVYPSCYYFIDGLKSLGDCELTVVDDIGSIREIIYRNPCSLKTCEKATVIM